MNAGGLKLIPHITSRAKVNVLVTTRMYSANLVGVENTHKTTALENNFLTIHPVSRCRIAVQLENADLLHFIILSNILVNQIGMYIIHGSINLTIM